MSETPIRRSQAEWDAFFLDFAGQVAHLSKDPDRQVGAVLVARGRRQFSIGYNGFPPEIEDLPSLLADKQFKLQWTVHAEENCLRQAPFDPAGSTIYVTRFPCHHCAAHIIKAGIQRVVAAAPELGHPRWGSSWAESLDAFSRNAVEVAFTGGTDGSQLELFE